jgi:SAM-dependent methyltransferase
MNLDKSLAASFDNEAEIYDKFRPGYPGPIFDTLIEVAGLDSGSKLLEIGSGTGQATVYLAQRGLQITAVEPGQGLAARAKEKLSPFPKVDVLNDNFEDAQLPVENFDLVFAAMSLHWVRPDKRFYKPHQLLKEDGYLAILYNWPLAAESVSSFYEALASVAKRHGYPDGAFQPIREEKVGIRPPVDTLLFDEPTFYVQHLKHVFKPGLAYAGFLATLSAVIAQAEEPRYKFLREVADLVENDFNNRLEIPYVTTLTMLKKR